MINSSFHFKKKISFSNKISKEEQEREMATHPKNIGPYELIEKLKDGGYSKIFKAKSNHTGDFVAIKIIDKMGFQESAEDVLLMIRQTEVLKILKHRNIVSLYEIYESTKYFYLIMDYLPNGDLFEKIMKQKRFKEEEALNIFSQLVDALNYMHKNEICHRDIRTEKILFDKKNKPKLVGFSYSSFYTKEKKIKDNYGSLCYACPEIIQNDYYNPELADVWSLGVVLYVMVCGYLPFSEDDDNKNKELIINGEVEYPPEISNKLKDLLKHMLDINPTKRYNFQKIIKHPWFKPYNESTLTNGFNIYKMIYPVDERILKIIIIYGFNKKEVDMNLKQNKFNQGTGLYKQLTDKFLFMGFKSYSDLCSEDFVEFYKDKENIISDGEKKYKKYIIKILEKIRKVERYVNEYKRKEDKVIRDLDSIIEDAEAEEMKKRQKEKEKMKKNMRECTKKVNNAQKKNKKNENINTNILHRRTISPMLTVKEQKELKDLLFSRIGYIKKDENKNNIQDKNNEKENNDFDALKNFEANNKINQINNIFIDDDDKIYNHKLKKCKSNPNVKELVKKLFEKDDGDDEYDMLYGKNNDSENSNDSEFTPIRRKRQASVMNIKRKRSYLNTSSINDSFLRKPKDDKERKMKIKNNLITSINQVIIEENGDEGNAGQNSDENCNDSSFNNENIIPEEKETKKVETKKNKNIKYSLSFGEDDEEMDESGYISKIESKQVSMYYDIEDELKELKDLKNTLKSPLRGPYLKQNTSDKKLLNFNIDNNNTIFGEHLDENNISLATNATALANINEKIDILTQLKKLAGKGSTELAKSKYNDESKIIENNQFKNDSFGEKQNINPIVFDDKLEISFHDENNDKNNGSNNNINNSNRNLKASHNSSNNNSNRNFILVGSNNDNNTCNGFNNKR